MTTRDAATLQPPCPGCAGQAEPLGGKPEVTSISLSAHTGLFEALTADLEREQVPLAEAGAGTARLLATPGLVTQIHTTPRGGVLVTGATTSGLHAMIRVVGSVAATYHASTLRFSVDPDARAVTVQLSSQQPIQLDRTWHFAFRDVIVLPDGRFGASSVELDAAKMAVAPQATLDQRCINFCHAQGIVAVLAACLPVLFLGPEAYLACAVGGAAASASTILCIIQCSGLG